MARLLARSPSEITAGVTYGVYRVSIRRVYGVYGWKIYFEWLLE